MDNSNEFAIPQDPAPQPPGPSQNPYAPPGATAQAPPLSPFPNPFSPSPAPPASEGANPPAAPLFPDAPPQTPAGPDPAPSAENWADLDATAAAALTPAPPAAAPAAGATYHWCPDCFLASSTPGNCVSCTQPLQQVNGMLPYGPFTPTVARPSKTRIFTAIFSMAILPALMLSGLWIYRLGDSASTNTGPNDGIVHTVAHTTVQFPGLGAVKLPGKWADDPVTRDSLQTNLNSDGGKGTAIGAWLSGDTTIWMASIVTSPSGGGGSCSNTPLGNGSLTIAGRAADSSDYKTVCSGQVSYSRTYQMQDKGGATLVIKIVSQVGTGSFNSIQNAFLALPGSQAGSVGL